MFFFSCPCLTPIVSIVYVRGTNTDTQDAGNWECTCSCKMRESGERRGKDKSIEESMSCACVRSRLTSPGTSTNANVL